MSAPHPESLSRCREHGKVRYISRAVAKKHAKVHRAKWGRMDVYPCGDFWHIGHLPKGVVMGVYSRDDLRPSRRGVA